MTKRKHDTVKRPAHTLNVGDSIEYADRTGGTVIVLTVTGGTVTISTAPTSYGCVDAVRTIHSDALVTVHPPTVKEHTA